MKWLIPAAAAIFAFGWTFGEWRRARSARRALAGCDRWDVYGRVASDRMECWVRFVEFAPTAEAAAQAVRESYRVSSTWRIKEIRVYPYGSHVAERMWL